MSKHSLDALREAWEAARAKAKDEPTKENREAAKAAWAACDAAAPKLKSRGFASRAGQRQAAERRAMTAAALARAGRD